MPKRTGAGWLLKVLILCVSSGWIGAATEVRAVDGKTLSAVLNNENKELGVKQQPVAVVDDLSYLRRVYVDLIGRIPSHDEIEAYLAMPAKSRRDQVVDKLMEDPRFVDRWTTFFADMFRLRSNQPGGAAALAHVYRSLKDNVPYDEMVRRFISANGKAGATPEVGYILGDNADPMALAGVTAQTFMGLRIACAQCHDHPFDKWTREDFYGFAAYFGKVRRYEIEKPRTIFTREVEETAILWPPEGKAEMKDRKPMSAKFLVAMAKDSKAPEYVTRLAALRKAEKDAREAAIAKKAEGAALDDLLADAGDKAIEQARNKKKADDVTAEATAERRRIDVKADLYNQSKLRNELAALITDPQNRYFSWCLVNRVWSQLVGKGFVEPVDDLSDDNKPSHPKSMNYLADEFVAGGFQIRPIVRAIVASEPYQRGQALNVKPTEQQELEAAFLAVPARRMLGEVLYDSIVTAGHLSDYKHPEGANKKTLRERIRVPIAQAGEVGKPQNLLGETKSGGAMNQMAMAGGPMGGKKGYNLEKGIELNFDDVLKQAEKENKEDVVIEQLAVKSAEELEAEQMMAMRTMRRTKYVEKIIERIIDDNPMFGSSFRMASPADPEHFVRVFGQTDRETLGEAREHNPSMRQALMMLNGKLTHEASRVGPMEPIHKFLTGESKDLNAAVKLAYLEILTRDASDEEVSVGKSIVADAANAIEGMADLRWVLLNSNEFRYLP